MPGKTITPVEALVALLALHDDQVFICGVDDEDKVQESLRAAREAVAGNPESCPNHDTSAALKDLYWEARDAYDPDDSDSRELKEALVAACDELHRMELMENGQYELELKALEGVQLKTAWFTFGQDHVHKVMTGQTLDKNWVVRIEAKDPRKVMFEEFGDKWAMQYDTQPDMNLYPCGEYVIEEIPD